MSGTGKNKGFELTILILILLGAAAFRYVGLDIAPPGMTGDEAMNGVNIMQLLAGTHPRGRFPIFFFDNVPKEPLFIYLQALSVMLLGKSIFALRFVSASIGMLTICSTYVLAKRLFNQRVALLSAGLLAFSFWHISSSRVGLRSVSLPLFVSLAFYFFWRGYDHRELPTGGIGLGSKRVIEWGTSGLFLGLALYTYPASRFAPLVLLAFLFYLCLRYILLRKGKLAKARAIGFMERIGGTGWVFLGLASLAVAMPLFIHWIGTPEDFTARSDSVLMFNPITGQGSLSELVSNAIHGLGMFSFVGEPASRWGMADRPIFDPVSSVFFYAGVAISIRYLFDPKRALVLMWLTIMILPDILTMDSPQFSRSTGALPVVFMFPALALDFVWSKAENRMSFSNAIASFVRGRSTFLVVSILWILLTAGLSYRDYFTVWAESQPARENFNGDLFSMDRYINQQPDVEEAYVAGTSPADWDRANSDFLVALPKKAKHFDARNALVFPAASTDQRVPILIGLSSPPEEIKKEFLPDDSEVYTGRYPDGAPSFEAYDIKELPRTTTDSGSFAIADLGGLVQLTGYKAPRTVTSPGNFRVILKWRILAKAERDDYSFFVHLLNGNQRMIAQQDGNGYASADWEPEEEFITWYDLTLPDNVETQVCYLDVGMYSWRDHKSTIATDPKRISLGTSIRLADVKVSGNGSATVAIPRHRLEVNFGNQILLAGYSWGPTPENQIVDNKKDSLILFWKALDKTDVNYTVFAHLLDGGGRMIGQRDSQPKGGTYPTSFWDKGELVEDNLDLANLSEVKHIAIGLYSSNGERLPVISANDVNIEDQFLIDVPAN